MVSISAERAALTKVGGGLIRREQWGARRSYTDARTVVEPARQVFIHVSVTNPAAYNSHAAHVRAIEAIGISRFPATGISYNRIILFGVGTAYEAQPVGRRGAHTVNNFGYSTCQRWGSQCPGQGGSFNTGGHGTNLNYSARAYCYGALCEASATDSVVDTFARTIAADMEAGLVRRDAEIHGHRCVSAKSCPCGMWAKMHDLRKRINHYLSNGLNGDDDVRPSDWNDADIDQVQAIINNAVVKHTDKNVAWHLRRILALLERPVRWADGEDRTATHTLSWLQRAVASVLEAQEGLDTAAILERIDRRAAEDAARDQAVLDAVTELESGDADAALARLRDLLDVALSTDAE